MISDLTTVEWREAESVCLIGLKTIIGDSGNCYSHDGNYGHRQRFRINGEDVAHLTTALGIDTRGWLENKWNPKKQTTEKVRCYLETGDFYIEEVFNHYPEDYGMKSLRVKAIPGHLELEVLMREKNTDSCWIESITYSGPYSIVWRNQESE